ncbi:MAG TPA: hypothetical protein VFZ77_16055 [Acidimicrobiales bacterium]
MIGLVDVESDDMVVVVDHVIRRDTHGLDRTRILVGAAAKHELVVAGTREGVQHATGIPSEVMPLRRPVADRDEQVTVGEHWDHWVHPRAAVGSRRGEIGERVLGEQAPAGSGHLQGFRVQLAPTCHVSNCTDDV